MDKLVSSSHLLSNLLYNKHIVELSPDSFNLKQMTDDEPESLNSPVAAAAMMSESSRNLRGSAGTSITLHHVPVVLDCYSDFQISFSSSF